MMEITTSCRTCMKNNTSLISLYEPFQSEELHDITPLMDLILDCLSIQVSQDDGLPQNICQDCARALHFIHNFRKQAFDAQQCFKTYFQNKEESNTESSIKAEVDIKSEIIEHLESFDEYSQDANSPKTEAVSAVEEADPKLFQCHICHKPYPSKKSLQRHFLIHDTSSHLLCSYCGKLFRKQVSLNSHIKKCKSYNECKICQENFSTEPLLLEHMKIHSDVDVKTEVESETARQFRCSECFMVFNKLRSLAMHKKKHKNRHTINSKIDKKYECDICKKEFKVKSVLKRHLKIHLNHCDKPLECPKCSKRFTRKDEFREHLKGHEIKENVCPYCNKGFTQLCSLKDHIRTHTGEIPYLCSECGKGFNNKSNLRQHMMRHTGIKPFACSVCPKTFCTKGQMTCHMTTHTGIHPYKCDQCGSAFTKPSSLKKHFMIHLGVRPFACDTCNMRFTCKDHLRRHARIHTGERPYKCKYCERAFSQSNDLVKHTRQHVGQNVYQCSLCYLRFRLKSELKQHYPVHYVNGDDPPVVPIDKDHTAPILMLKPEEGAKINEALSLEPQEIPDKEYPKDPIDRTITITISRNGLEKNGLAGDITINISPEKS